MKIEGNGAEGADDVDGFSTAFDELTSPKAGEGEEPKPEEEKPAEEPPVEEPKVEEPKPAEEPKVEEPKVEEPKVEEPKPEAAKPSTDDILAGLEKLIKPVETPKSEEPKSEEKPLYTAEETAFLESYGKEWEDVARGEELKRRAEYKDLLTYVFSEVAKYVGPVKEITDTLASRTHLLDIETAIPDYSDQLRDDVTAWVETQPAYLQPAYNHVINAGTPDEVVDLVTRYRASTGKQPAPAAGAPAKPGKGNELSEQAKKAADALAPVESKRSGVEVPGDPSNFDDAWQIAAREVG